MEATTKKKENDRIELRVSKEDKELFEYARTLRGFKSFSEFARLAIYKEARVIVAEEKSILVSKRDKEVFFNALMSQEDHPNEALLSAIKYHNEILNT